VTEHRLVNHWNEHSRERSDHANDGRPEEELILVQGAEESDENVALGVHVEEAESEVLSFQSHEGDLHRHDGVGSSSSLESEIASFVVAFIAILSQIAVANTDNDDHVAYQAEDTGNTTIDELVDDELCREDTSLEGVWWPKHDICRSFLQSQTYSEEG